MKNTPDIADIDAQIAEETANPELLRSYHEKKALLFVTETLFGNYAQAAQFIEGRIQSLEDMHTRIPVLVETRRVSLDRLQFLARGGDLVSALRLHKFDTASDAIRQWAPGAAIRIAALKTSYREQKTRADEAGLLVEKLTGEVAALLRQIAVEAPPVTLGFSQ